MTARRTGSSGLARNWGPSRSADVTLRPVTADDLPWLDQWLGAVSASVRYDAIDLAQPAAPLVRRLREEPELRARIIERDGDDVGLVAYRLNAPTHGEAMFELIGLPREKARFGSGMMAAAAAEREMIADGVRVIYAPAPEVHGIAVYFWIRLGYRPLQRTEWPCERTGVLWMQRRLDG